MSYFEERRADRVAEREQDRIDRRERADAEAARRAEDDERRRRERADQRREKGQRRAARRARWAKVTRWLNTNPATIFVGYVMVASVVPAVISQVSALTHAGVWTALAWLLASMLEGGAWALTFMGRQAEDAGRPTGRYRVAAWATATVAAGIQYWHWAAIAPAWVALVFALSSLFAIYLWDLKTHGSAGATIAERRERRARARQQRQRRWRFRDVHRRYRQILTARPYGTIADEDAWAEAWTDVKGAPLGCDATTIARRMAATGAVEQAVAAAGRSPESLAVDALLADLFPAHGKGDEGPGGTPLRGPSGGPPKGGAGGATALGRKGKQAPEAPSPKEVRKRAAKTPQKPVAEDDLKKVGALADILGGAEHLSARRVREALGCATEYAIRVRDAVQRERGTK